MIEPKDWLWGKFADNKDAVAVIAGSREVSYGELTALIDGYFEQLQAQVPAQSITAIVSDYSPEAIALFFALVRLEAVIVPMTLTTDDELQQKLEESQADFKLSFDDGLDLQIEAVAKAESDKRELIIALRKQNANGLILFSSGTTGKPKAMLHNLDNLIDAHFGKRSKSTRILVFLMFDHIGGLNTLFGTFAVGGTLIIPNNRDPAHIGELIEKHGIRALPASPTFLNLMIINGVHETSDLSSLKLISYGTEAMPEALLQRLRTIFPRTKLLQTFGTSETGIAKTQSLSSDSTLMKITDPDYEHKIVDGELWLRSKTQISGYLNEGGDKFSDDGWFKTGDLVETADDGYLKIIGRKTEMINVGGEKVLPGEIETALLELDEVLDCTVYAKPNPIMGQAVAADVVMREKASNREAKKIIRDACRDKLAAYKLPSIVRVVDATQVGARMKKVRRLADEG